MSSVAASTPAATLRNLRISSPPHYMRTRRRRGLLVPWTATVACGHCRRQTPRRAISGASMSVVTLRSGGQSSANVASESLARPTREGNADAQRGERQRSAQPPTPDVGRSSRPPVAGGVDHCPDGRPLSRTGGRLVLRGIAPLRLAPRHLLLHGLRTPGDNRRHCLELRQQDKGVVEGAEPSGD